MIRLLLLCCAMYAQMEDLELPLKAGASPIAELESQLSTDPEGADPSTEEMSRIYELEARLPIDFKQLEKPLRRLQDEKEISRKYVYYYAADGSGGGRRRWFVSECVYPH